METSQNKTNKVAWYIIIILTVLLFLFSCKQDREPLNKVCYVEGREYKCDTFTTYEIVPFLIFDSCYKFKLNKTDYKLICDNNFTIIPIK